MSDLKPDIITAERLIERGYKNAGGLYTLGDISLRSDRKFSWSVEIKGSEKIPIMTAKSVCKFSQLELLKSHQQKQIQSKRLSHASFTK